MAETPALGGSSQKSESNYSAKAGANEIGYTIIYVSTDIELTEINAMASELLRDFRQEK